MYTTCNPKPSRLYNERPPPPFGCAVYLPYNTFLHEGSELGGWSLVFSRGFKAPRAHAQVAGPWCVGPLVAGRFSCSLWRVSRLVHEVWCVCLFFVLRFGSSWTRVLFSSTLMKGRAALLRSLRKKNFKKKRYLFYKDCWQQLCRGQVFPQVT